MGKSTFKKIVFASSSTKKRKFDPKIKNIPDFIVSLQARKFYGVHREPNNRII